MSLFDTGIRPTIDKYLLEKSKERRNYGDYWSASSAGYCMRKSIFERLQLPYVKEDARKARVFEVGHVFHAWLQEITKESGLSIAQELELKDEELMILGHIDDLVLIGGNLILYDLKTQNSRAFSYKRPEMSHFHKMQLGTYMYMLRKYPEPIVPDDYEVTRHDQYDSAPGSDRWDEIPEDNKKLLLETGSFNGGHFTREIDQDIVTQYQVHKLRDQLTEARILKISKDDLRMIEEQLMWSDELEKEVRNYWTTLNEYWKARKLPPCTCADHEGGFMSGEKYNPFWYDGEPCSLKWYEKCKAEGLLAV